MAASIQKLLIANRGEIACRIMRTCKKLGITAVAVYSEADANSAHVRQADIAIAIGPAESRASYLNIDVILAAAKESGADAIHPGYGFLSENAAFVAAVEKAGLTFIGPSAAVIRALGDKLAAKVLASKAKVPLLPSLALTLDSKGEIVEQAALKKFVTETGFPLIVKAAGGGGGRGMRKAWNDAELIEGLRIATREAGNFFGDSRVYIERLVEKARHIEVQIFGDQFGNVQSLLDRDCTMQRFHQKVIEEAPAPGLAIELRAQIHSAAERLCRSAGYRNAGTVEFLLDPNGGFYFMEVNGRLQVEHPVTEMITGLDLVALQIEIACGRDLAESPISVPAIAECGAAIEVRLCAESPQDNFAASTGRIDCLDLPTQSASAVTVRCDSGFEAGDYVTHYYDSMLAKVIVHGPTRAAATEQLRATLARSCITGVRTNIGFLRVLLESPEFTALTHHINFAQTLTAYAALSDYELAVAALNTALSLSQKDNMPGPWGDRSGWRLAGVATTVQVFEIERRAVTVQLRFSSELGAEATVTVGEGADSSFKFTDCRVELVVQPTLESAVSATISFCNQSTQSCLCFALVRTPTGLWAYTPKGYIPIAQILGLLKARSATTAAHSTELRSPLPGKIIAVLPSVGAAVKQGDTLVTLESMKMEHPLKAPNDGTVETLHVRAGDIVEAQTILVTFEAL